MKRKSLSKYFIRGMMTLLPAVLTIAVLVWFIMYMEELSKSVISLVSRELYFPGMGIIVGVIVICFLGYLTTLRFTDRIFLALELPFKNVPIVKSIYSAFKSFSDYFDPDGKSINEQQVVAVRIPGHDAEIVGLVTLSDFKDLPNGILKGDRVAVYIPLSYMIGGWTFFVPRTWVTKVDMRVEEAMKATLIAWMPLKDKNNKINGNNNGNGDS